VVSDLKPPDAPDLLGSSNGGSATPTAPRGAVPHRRRRPPGSPSTRRRPAAPRVRRWPAHDLDRPRHPAAL